MNKLNFVWDAKQKGSRKQEQPSQRHASLAMHGGDDVNENIAKVSPASASDPSHSKDCEARRTCALDLQQSAGEERLDSLTEEARSCSNVSVGPRFRPTMPPEQPWRSQMEALREQHRHLGTLEERAPPAHGLLLGWNSPLGRLPGATLLQRLPSAHLLYHSVGSTSVDIELAMRARLLLNAIHGQPGHASTFHPHSLIDVPIRRATSDASRAWALMPFQANNSAHQINVLMNQSRIQLHSSLAAQSRLRAILPTNQIQYGDLRRRSADNEYRVRSHPSTG